MKKLRILIGLIILAFSFSVKAEVLLEIDCNGKEITSDKSITCEGWLSYETEGINDIEIGYDTNLDIKFSSLSGFMVTNLGNKVSIHSDTKLYDRILNSAKIMEFTLSSNENSKEKESIKFHNLKINKEDTVIIENVFSEEFKVSIPKKEEPTPEEVKKSSVCTLESITVDKVNVKDFDKEKLEYRGIEVEKEVVSIDAVRTSDKSSASGLGDVKVPKGETIERDIVVIAEDDTKRVYKLYITNITPKVISPSPTIEPTITPTPTSSPTITPEVTVTPEPKSNDNTLKSLELYNKKDKIEFEFDKTKDDYDIKIEDVVIEKLTIKATLNDSKASFVKNYGPRDVKLNYGKNKILIKIKAENDDEKIVTLNINYVDKREKDNSLDSLIISDKEIDLTEEKLEVKVPNTVTKTKIEAKATSEKAKLEYEDIDLKVGDNSLTIKVISEEGKTKEYIINVIREEEEKIVFEKIEISDYKIDFAKDKKEYNLKINNDTKELDIKVYPDKVESDITGNNNLKDGSEIKIKVTDNTDTYEYTIHIEKDSSNIILYLVIGFVMIAVIILVVLLIIKKKKRQESVKIEEI